MVKLILNLGKHKDAVFTIITQNLNRVCAPSENLLC